MEESMLALDGFVPLVVGIVIFILLWVVIYKTLKEVAFFKGKAVETIVATCVSLLSVIGIFQFLGAGDRTYNVSERIGGEGMNLDAILLGYAALGITIILLALYLLASKLLGNDKSERSFRDAERKTEPTFQLDLGKGDRPAEENLGKAFKEKEMARDNSERLKPIDRPLGKRMHESDFHRETKSNRIKQ
jgi:hypothetical protein